MKAPRAFNLTRLYWTVYQGLSEEFLKANPYLRTGLHTYMRNHGNELVKEVRR